MTNILLPSFEKSIDIKNEIDAYRYLITDGVRGGLMLFSIARIDVANGPFFFYITAEK